MREREVEERFVAWVKAQGGVAYKFVSPGHKGVPDRICFLPGGVLMLAELKAPGKKLRPDQKREHKVLEDLGFHVHVWDGG